MDGATVAKAYFDFGRMNVYIDQGGVEIEP
jgi:hypothetical protein